jgi:prepilin-type N-terminal cleavage/methylation domain-containing protein
MKKTFSQKKSAFSLIELSIVLIIIGLLIAGVTGGASLIKSSELRSIMGEARAYATAVNGFYTQFNYLPGDYATVIGTSGGGDADGKIEYAFTCTVNSDSEACSEGSNAWVHMLAARVIDTNVISSSATILATSAVAATQFGVNLPASKVKASGWGLDYRIDEGDTYAQNVVVLTGAIGAAGSSVGYSGAGTEDTLVNDARLATAAITPPDALSIDAKIDDTNAYRGKVRGVNLSGATSCYSTTTYATTDTTKKCALSYQVDVNS